MIKYIPLNQNILQAAVAEINAGKCLLLFPTRRSKLAALKLYQPNWNFGEHSFLTMDEWKESLFVSDQPILKEEKRTLAFYQSLSRSAKDFFHLNSYFQIIDFAKNFFDFRQELKEELVTDDRILEILEQKQTAGDWQLKTWQMLLSIEEDYRTFLHEHGFADQLFLRDNHLCSQELSFDRIIVVNQFYFTEFEKQLLTKLSDKFVILSQLPAARFDEKNLQISSEFNAADIKPFLPAPVHLHIAADQTEMIAQLASELTKSASAEIIDFQFEKQSYAHLLSRQYFGKSTFIGFSESRFYRFLQTILELENSLIWEGKPFLISLQAFLSLLAADDLLAYFLTEKAPRERFRTYIFGLIDQDFKYLDTEFFQTKNSEFMPVWQAIYSFLQEVNQIKSIAGMIDFLRDRLDLSYLLADLANKTKLAETLLQSLADFASIETCGVVTDWQQIFPTNTAANLFKLFLDYLKPKKLNPEFQIVKTRSGSQVCRIPAI